MSAERWGQVVIVEPLTAEEVETIGRSPGEWVGSSVVRRLLATIRERDEAIDVLWNMVATVEEQRDDLRAKLNGANGGT